MKIKNISLLTPNPLDPPYQGEDRRTGDEGIAVTPSPDKGRAREGLAFLPYNKNLTSRARENRKNPTFAETKIWNEVLRMRQFSRYKFLRQKPIGNYVVDFYCSELRIVIEIDGDSHADTVSYDTERTQTLNACGLVVIRYSNHDVLTNIAGVYDDMLRQLKRLTEDKNNP